MADKGSGDQFEDISQVRSIDVYRLVAQDAEIQGHRPDSQVSVDPRSGLRIIYSPSREHRPHDHPPAPPPG